MDFSLPAGRCVTVLLPGGVGLTAGAAGQILALARRRCGAPVWAGAAADVFSGRGEGGRASRRERASVLA